MGLPPPPPPISRYLNQPRPRPSAKIEFDKVNPMKYIDDEDFEGVNNQPPLLFPTLPSKNKQKRRKRSSFATLGCMKREGRNFLLLLFLFLLHSPHNSQWQWL